MADKPPVWDTGEKEQTCPKIGHHVRRAIRVCHYIHRFSYKLAIKQSDTVTKFLCCDKFLIVTNSLSDTPNTVYNGHTITDND